MRRWRALGGLVLGLPYPPQMPGLGVPLQPLPPLVPPRPPLPRWGRGGRRAT